MGMYTEIFFRGEVDDEAWKFFDSVEQGYGSPVPDHPFFSKPRWRHTFIGGSYYFPGANHFKTEDDQIGKVRSVSFRADLKNYDGEIESFFDWVGEHVLDAPGSFMGYSLYEEDREPRLFYVPAA